MSETDREAEHHGRPFDQLRASLLDLSQDDPMLNYRHRVASRRQVRIIDCDLEQVFTELEKGELPLAALPEAAVVQCLVAAHALARGVLPAMSMSLPYARKDGLAAGGGRPDSATAATAAALALLIALLSLPWINALAASLLAVAAAIGMGWLAQRQIGGQTGDVLGGAEQVGETAILVLLAARLA